MDIKDVKQITAKRIFCNDGVVEYTDKDTLYSIYEQAKSKHNALNGVLPQLWTKHDYLVRTMKVKTAVKLQAMSSWEKTHNVTFKWTADNADSESKEYLNQARGAAAVIEEINKIIEETQRIEIQALNAIKERGW